MSFPTITEYRNALQNPQHSIPWAANVEVVRDRTGLPIVHSGNFAAAFRIRRGRESWSLRCFHRPVPDLEARVRSYQAFHKKVAGELKAFLLPEELHTIQVRGTSLPVVFMPWVEGEGLRKWVASHRGDPAALKRTKAGLVRLYHLLEEVGAVHGDLQTGNIVVRPDGSPVLLDYDSFTFRGGPIRNPGNQGHPGFQHPAYDCGRHGPHADKLPFLILCLALDGLARSPSLWEPFGEKAEGLLFEPSDLRNPKKSLLLEALNAEAGMGPWAEWLEELLRRDPADLPGLSGLLTPPMHRGGAFVVPSQRPQLEKLMAKRQSSLQPQPRPPVDPPRLPEPSPATGNIPDPPCPVRRRMHPLAALFLILAGGMLAWAGRAAVRSIHQPHPAPVKTAASVSPTQLRAALKMSVVATGRTEEQERALLADFDRLTAQFGTDPLELKARLTVLPLAPEAWVAWVKGHELDPVSP